MRWLCAMVVTLAGASAASGQVLWAGVAAGTSWEWQAPTAPEQNFLHSTDGAPSVFVAFPVDAGTLVRLRVSDLPHEVAIDGVGWPGRLRAYTVGIDYFYPEVFGRTVFSAGLGSYDLHLKAKHPPAGIEESKFGWYFGVGEWFGLTRRSRVTVEITMHRTSHTDSPIIVAATAGLAFSF
jgi:hypothetical protein